MPLRDYQQKAVDKLFQFWEKSSKPCMLQLATGAGKSHIIAEIVRKVGVPTLVLQPTKEILEQNLEKLNAVGIYPTVCSSSAGDWKISDVTLATIGTIRSYVEYCRRFKVIVVDECVDSDHEVLTPSGWVKIGEAKDRNLKIAQYDSGSIEFVQPSRWTVKTNSTDKVKLTIAGEGVEKPVELFMTQNHRQLVKFKDYRTKQWSEKTVLAKDLPECLVNYKLVTGASRGVFDKKSSPLDRLKIAIAADAYVRPYKDGSKYYVRMAFRRQRKITRLESLLDECEVPYNKRRNTRGDIIFTFYVDFPKDMTNIDLASLTYSSARELCGELFEWDGNRKAMNFDTTRQNEADFAQALAVLGGYQTTITHQDYDGRHNIRVHFMDKVEKYLEPRVGSRKEIVPHNGMAYYCPTVPSSYFVVRKNGFVYVTGNCDVVPNDRADSMYMEFFDDLDTAKIVGLTATPWRNQTFQRQYEDPRVYCRPVTRIHTNGGEHTKYGEWFWKSIIYRCSIADLQAMDYLSKTQYYFVPTDWSFIEDVPGRVEYEMEQMTQWVDVNENTSTFTKAIKWCMDNNLKTIVFSPNVDMNFQLNNVISSLGGASTTLDSTYDNRKTREAKMAALRSGKVQFLVNVGMVGRGVDVPSVDCVIWCRPTKSLSFWVQGVGRCLRKDPDNPDKTAFIIDLTENMKRFGKAEDVTIEKIEAISKHGLPYQQDAIMMKRGGRKVVWDRVS